MAASASTIEVEVPCVSPPIDEEHNDNKEDNNDGNNDEEDDDNNDGDEEHDNHDNDEEDTGDNDEEDIFDFTLNDAYAMAMSYYKERGTNKFIDLSFVDITHFSAVMCLQDHETLVKMDVSMAKFANVNVDSVRYFQTTNFTHLHQMSNLID